MLPTCSSQYAKAQSQEEVLKPPIVTRTLASFTGREREFPSPCCCGEISSNGRRSAVLLTLPLCCFHINIFTGTSSGNEGSLSGLWREGKLCSPHANGMHLSQLRVSVIWYHVPFQFCLDAFPLTQCLPFILTSNKKQLGSSEVHVQIPHPFLWPRKQQPFLRH